MENNKNLVSGIAFIVIVTVLTLFISIPETGSSPLSRREKEIIKHSGSVMYVLNVADPQDSLILRTKCDNFTERELSSHEFQKLSEIMLSTVQSDQQGGVGLAAPQVGITHRVIAVCRMDKEGEPYEIYPNVRIDSLYGEVTMGPEGCLSIPPYRGEVPRYSDIILAYKNISTMSEVKEHISGYTAIIFQHECDHLDGILYTDRADSVYVNQNWENERKEYAAKGLYDKPQWISKLLQK